ncbi:chemotaxis protein CheW [Desulfonatronum thioautotrophicum]|uniref:chemotaxis protein CheW n=1 Tax=Desulfonatronum thioautotrophicum TaxID=617001 RepID=UPI0005EB8DD7|nr:chemotaxis protein CheW [Desulfonatronum thioautotrophicum]
MSQTDLMEDDLYDEDEDTLSSRYLTFRLGDEDFGIEIRYVTEIVGVQKITEVPDMPDFVKGVINLRGQVIPVMDVRLRFNMAPRDYDERTCVIVVDINGSVVGLIVDTVQEVREILPDNVSPPPKLGRSEKARYILGMGKVGDEVKILLDVGRLLREDEIAALRDNEP